MTHDKNKKTAVPALRFPEFRDSGEWEDKKLEEVGVPLMCKRILKEQTTTEKEDNIPFYKIGTFGEIADAYISKDIFDEYKRKYSYPNKGDILISAAGTIGRLVVYNGEPAYFQDSNIVWIGNTEIKVLNIFLYYIYQILKWQTSDGGIVSRLYNNDLKNMTVIIPKNQIEQQKIADCLSSLDDLIAAVADKIEALREHKKGLMQQLFPAEGKTTPALRFPEFRDSGEWHKKRIKDLKLDIITGFAFKGNDISELKDGIRLMRGINITEGYIRHTDDIDRYYLGSTERLSKYVLKINDLVIGMDGSKVGKNISLITDIDSESLLVQRVARLRSQNDSLIKYLFQQINSSRFFSYVDRINTSSGIPHISQKQIEEFMVWIPDDGLEVKKIGDLLASIDDQVFSETQKLETLKSHKKGLMQQLFPTIKN